MEAEDWTQGSQGRHSGAQGGLFSEFPESAPRSLCPKNPEFPQFSHFISHISHFIGVPWWLFSPT